MKRFLMFLTITLSIFIAIAYMTPQVSAQPPFTDSQVSAMVKNLTPQQRASYLNGVAAHNMRATIADVNAKRLQVVGNPAVPPLQQHLLNMTLNNQVRAAQQMYHQTARQNYSNFRSEMVPKPMPVPNIKGGGLFGGK